MFITFSTCDVCGKIIEGRDCLPVVEAECAGCGARVRICPKCKRRGCPICGSGLRNAWALPAAKGTPLSQVAKGQNGRRRA
ncbi:MAG: hypothetical protein ABC542_03525 [Candidatus Methanosuratincola petrocarbonis]